MKISVIPYGTWRRNLQLATREIELIATLDVGPRILRFGFRGGPNVFGEFPEQLGRKAGKKWMLWGGHRLWVAPERKPETYEIDNGPVACRRIPGGVRLVAPAGPLTGIQKTLEIRPGPRANQVRVRHILTNRGSKPVECSPWALSVMARRGLAIIPLPRLVPHDQRTLPNQNWSLWAYTDIADPRWTLGPGFVLVRQDPARGPMKLGLAQREGWVAYQAGESVFVKQFSRDDRAAYPDHDVNFEVYTDRRILELESLGPLAKLAPGRSAAHDETWSLFRGIQRCRTIADARRRVVPLIRRLSAGRG